MFNSWLSIVTTKPCKDYDFLEHVINYTMSHFLKRSGGNLHETSSASHTRCRRSVSISSLLLVRIYCAEAWWKRRRRWLKFHVKFMSTVRHLRFNQKEFSYTVTRLFSRNKYSQGKDDYEKLRWWHCKKKKKTLGTWLHRKEEQFVDFLTEI